MITLKESKTLPSDGMTLSRKIVLRFNPSNDLHPFVVHTAFKNPETKEWSHSWGHYFGEYFTAHADFNKRSSKLR